ncbi:LacI family DNA-binding transcriptional regulator [Actinoplanes sp. LDG1-06]|uniref:LacI family DNA-binding transcriptional regulator n=1 Tax=Paractinoplanes ovalisporus TaxID=2810368 RepID=A0ABS2AKI0_9ACTN|nr:LacI family DNA-binding transcriptional regulator [Actinoplanes ovalisporus]MBM2620320.1 LacI family DNA-binding transcriptional regulator [Actinoplanes ovalisporus]
MTKRAVALNMADLAERAGVSIATVSRALSGAPGVSEETRRKIRLLADDLSYAVSPDAARLARGSSGRVAVVTPDVSHWFYAAMLDGIVTGLRGTDLDVLLYEVKQERERRRFFSELPARRQVDALILVALPISDDERRRLDLMGVTVVMAGGTLGDHPHVRIDDVEAGRQATAQLVRAGHTRIAMINSTGTWSLEYAAPGARLRGFTGVLEEAGLEVRPELVVHRHWGSHGGVEGMSELLSLPEPPTGVVAFSDEVAFGALRTLRRAGVAVPYTMSVVGIDDHHLADMFDLTTVRQPVTQQGKVAGQLVHQILQKGDIRSPHVTLPTQVVARGTIGPPPGVRT